MNNMELCKSITLLVLIGAAFAHVASASSDEIKIDGQWREWSKWSKCNAICGDGQTFRTRFCKEPKYGGRPCQGDEFESKKCNNKCKVNGQWKEWSKWSECNAICGDGQTFRTRFCIEPTYGGWPCHGRNFRSKKCNNKCKVDGQWREWSKWSECNGICGDGQTFRTRFCIEPKYGGRPCQGDEFESKKCNNNNSNCKVRNLAVLFNESEFQLRPSYKVVGRCFGKNITHVSGMKFKEFLTVDKMKEILSSVFTNAKRIRMIKRYYGYASNGDKVIEATSAEGGATDGFSKWIYCDRDGNRYKWSELKGWRRWRDLLFTGYETPFPLSSDCRSVIWVLK